MHKFIYLLPITLILLSFGKDANAQTYEISFRNRSNQTLTSAVCVVHNRSAKMFEVGKAASSGLAELAEDGSASQFVSELRSADGVSSVATGGFLSPDDRDNIEISGKRRSRRLSCVFGMLVSTNDGFPAITNIRLPRKVGKRRRFRAQAYDAGSEVNTESCEHVPGPPCDAHFIGIAENGVIAKHEGIQGIADVSPERYGWTGPVVRGVVRRVK